MMHVQRDTGRSDPTYLVLILKTRSVFMKGKRGELGGVELLLFLKASASTAID